MSKEKAVKQAVADLAAAGIDASVTPDQAVANLRQTVSEAGAGLAELIPKIAAAASHLESPEAAGLLAELETGASGATRRVLRQALFKLHQRGIEPPSRPAQAVPAPEAAASLTGLISPVDFEGARVAWLLKHRGHGAIARLWGLCSERDGLLAVTLSSLSGRELREEREQFEQRAGVRLVEADWRLVDFILTEAFRATPEDKRLPVGSFLMHRAELVTVPVPQDFVHPIYEEFKDSLDRPPSLELLKEPEIQAVAFSEDKLKPLAEEIREIQQSPLVLNQFQQQERVNALLGRTVSQFFSGAESERMRRRFEDTAYYLARSGRRAPAAWAASVAAGLRSGADPATIPLLIEMVREAVSAVMGREREAAAGEPRLIMTPVEAMRAAAARKPHEQR